MGAMLVADDLIGSVLLQGCVKHAYSAFGLRGPTYASCGFTGVHMEPGWQGYLMGNGYRAYMTWLGRFMTADEHSPFGRGGCNAYAYCYADPVNREDKSGCFSLSGFVSAMLEAGRNLRAPRIAPENLAFTAVREYVEREVRPLAGHPMINNLLGVNRNFMLSGIGGLKAPHANFYVEASHNLASGSISSTSFAIGTGRHWFADTAHELRRLPEATGSKHTQHLLNAGAAAVGALANFASIPLAAGLDHTMRMRGSVLSRQARRRLIPT